MNNLADEIRWLPEAPQGTTDLDIRTTKAYVAQDEGDLVFVIRDDDVTVTLDMGLGGSGQNATDNAEALAAAARSYAELLRAQYEDKNHAGRSGRPAAGKEHRMLMKEGYPDDLGTGDE